MKKHFWNFLEFLSKKKDQKLNKKRLKKDNVLVITKTQYSKFQNHQKILNY